MKFIINRASGNTPPCEGATEEEVTCTYQQKCHLSDKLSAPLRWIEKNNHTYRVEDGFRKWDVTLKRWVIEIHTLEELVALQKEVGDLILSSDKGLPQLEIYGEELPYLKIYDSYIE